MRFPRLAYNFLSAVGAAIALVTGLFIIVMLVINFTLEQAPAYFGIFLYMVLPPFLIVGLFLIPVGMYRQWRRVRRQEELEALSWPVIDLNDRRHRNATFVFVFGSVGFFVITAVGGYEAYHYSESVAFCGTTCHTVMEPQHTAYQGSPHARVKCVECHVGTGADWYAKSKLSGAYQVYATAADVFPRPIPTPIKDLRPARETCEQCHWPEKTYGRSIRKFAHYQYDEENTPWTIEMMIITDTGEPHQGQKAGIHWHINPNIQIEYVARDPRRLDIPWVRVTDRESGVVTIYQDEDDPLEESALASMEIRVMDCIDCHNRPSHIYRSPNYAIDRALQAGFIDGSLPEIKRIAVEALAKDYATKDEGLTTIASTINEFYQKKGLMNDPEQRRLVQQAIAGAQQAFSQNIFPEMKARWDNYPNNIGHFDDIGCMRCHGGSHKSPGGAVITHDCNACHTITLQGRPGQMQRDLTGEGLEFEHPYDIDRAWEEMGCHECHTGVQP